MGKYYAVANGRSRGVYDNWDTCKSQVNGYSGAQFKSFSSRQEAEAFLGANRGGRATQSSRSYSGGSGGFGGSNSRSSYSGDSYSGSSPSRSTRSTASASRGSTASGGQRQVVYTDGSALGNGKSGSRAGWGTYWGPGDARNSSGKVTRGEQTNNRGELLAIHSAVKQINREATKGSSYEIRADSQYARDSLGKWGNNWESNGWKTSSGGDVKNRDIIEPTRQQIQNLRDNGVNVTLSYIPGHAGHAGNEAADRLARDAAGRD